MTTKAGETRPDEFTSYKNVDVLKTWLLGDLLNFTRFFFKVRFKRKFIVNSHHRIIATALNRVYNGETKRLIINIAPRYGKTELAVKNFIAMGLALNPSAKFIHLSYSDDLVRDNSSDIVSLMNEVEYKQLFEARNITNSSKKWYTQYGGGVYAVSSAGQVTGFGAGLVDDPDKEDIVTDKDLDDFFGNFCNPNTNFGGAIVIDDPIKPDDVLSPTIRDKVNYKFDSTIKNRVNSRNTPIIIIMQRLHEDDLCGYILKEDTKKEWEVVSLPCLYTDDNGEQQALWEFKHTKEELEALRLKNSYVFQTQYQQNPMPIEGLMYELGFKEYSEQMVVHNRIRKAYVDTADMGSDYLCAIVYDETELGMYVLDVMYTQKPMEYTEPALAKMLTRWNVERCYIESNNGGRNFARTVENNCRTLGNNNTSFIWFHQTLNKETRIFTHSSAVQNLIFMPAGWKKLFPDFATDVLSYMRVGNNPHDDAPDVLTGMVEKMNATLNIDDYADYFGY